jgi:hypothetical protein
MGAPPETRGIGVSRTPLLLPDNRREKGLWDEGRHDAARNFLRGSQHQKSRTPLPIAAGAHRLRSPTRVAFGIKVYGIAEYTSYMDPGGLDLQRITPG